MKRKMNIREIEPDETLKTGEGWVKMDVRWLVTEKTVGSKNLTFGHTIFPPGSRHASHKHPNAEEVVYVIKGKGLATSGKHSFEVGPGDAIFIPKGDPHFLRNTSETELLEVVWAYAGARSLEKAGYKLTESRI